jgi:4-hydroxy-3-polyprenylbenzoate decarboxylase
MKMVMGISGTSSAIYGVRAVEALYVPEVEVHLVICETTMKKLERGSKHVNSN